MRNGPRTLLMVRNSTFVEADGCSPAAVSPIPRLFPKRCNAPLMAVRNHPALETWIAAARRRPARRRPCPVCDQSWRDTGLGATSLGTASDGGRSTVGR